MARCARGPLEVAGAGVADMGRLRTSSGRRHPRANPRQAGGLAVAMLAVAGALAWYFTRPTPHYVTYSVSAPGLTEYNDNGISSIKPLKIVFSESAAPLKPIAESGDDRHRPVPGDCRHLVLDDRQTAAVHAEGRLAGRPRIHGAVCKEGFFAAQVAARGVPIRRQEPALHRAASAESQFYQDPRDPNLKKLVATLTFSHPVDTEQLESRVSLAVAKDAEYLGLTPDSRHFTVRLRQVQARGLHSFGRAGHAARRHADDAARSTKACGPREAATTPRGRLEAVVTIPGRTSLRFADARMTVVDNARYEPEQILLLTSSSPVAERAFAGAVSHVCCRFATRGSRKKTSGRTDWDDEAEIGADILAKAEAGQRDLCAVGRRRQYRRTASSSSRRSAATCT